MIRIWIFMVVVSAAIAEEANLTELFSFGSKDDKTNSGVYGDLDKGCYDCYKCDHPEIAKFKHLKKKELKLIDARGQVTNVCCKAQIDLTGRSGGSCGSKKPGGIKLDGKKQNTTHARSTLVGEYPWRAWIWRKGDSKPFCAGTIVEVNLLAVLTSARCAMKYPPTELQVTFDRTSNFGHPIDVGERVVHEAYNKDKPYENDIALLFRTIRHQKIPKWVSPACLSRLPPMQPSYCTVMSENDYFIDTLVLEPKKCEIEKQKPDIGRMCTATLNGDYEPEIGAGLFCQDRLRTQTKDYYVSGITLKINKEVIAYTNVSHFKDWIDDKIEERNVIANERNRHYG